MSQSKQLHDEPSKKTGFLGNLKKMAKEKLSNLKDLTLNQIEHQQFQTESQRLDKINNLLKEAQNEENLDRKQKFLQVAFKLNHPMFFKGSLQLNQSNSSLERIIVELILLNENQISGNQQELELYEILEFLNPQSAFILAKNIRKLQHNLLTARLLQFHTNKIEQNLFEIINNKSDKQYSLLQEKQSSIFIEEQTYQIRKQQFQQQKNSRKRIFQKQVLFFSGYFFSFLTGYWFRKRLQRLSSHPRRIIFGGLVAMLLLPLLTIK